MAAVIKQLDASVVNRIAAGEVIQRPSSALKELLENSLDAGATQISITVKEGGNKLLQVADNGHGIRKADLPILCHRHTTSKLSSFEDLESIRTLGFRGEALCSISHVSNMTVTTMTPDALHGYRVSYKDGEMVAPGPKPIAAVPGTTITVEDLFYNVPTRRNALKSATEEYARVVDIVSRYAIFRQGVAFSCKRQGESRADVSTLVTATRLDNIRSVYGPAVAKELLPLSLKVGPDTSQVHEYEEEVSFTLEGYISSANYSAKRPTFVLFINERAVECGPLRRAIEATYAAVLPKASKPFVFLDLRLPPKHVEVNVHPTKREVGMLNQDAIIEAVRTAVESKLTASNSTRTFTQAPLPFAPPPVVLPAQVPLRERSNNLAAGPPDQAGGPAQLPRQPSGTQAGVSGTQATGAPSYYRPDKLVRVDARNQTIDGFLVRGGSSGAGRSGSLPAAGAGTTAPPEGEQEPMVVDLVEAPDGDEDQGGVEAAAHARQDSRQGLDPSQAPPAPRNAAVRGSIARKRAAPGSGPMAGINPLDVDPLDMDDYMGGGQPPQLPTPASALPSPQLQPQPSAGRGPLGVMCELDSVRDLAQECERATHLGLLDLVRGAILVGMATSTLALVQYQTRLYLVNMARLAHDFFYQQVLRRFECMPQVRLDPAPPITELMAMALTLEEAAGRWRAEEHGPAQEVCSLAGQLLQEKGPMLGEYLGIRIDDQGCLTTLPCLLDGWPPDLGHLPDLVLALSRDVEWEEEGACFRSLALVVADFYSCWQTTPRTTAGEQGGALGPWEGRQTADVGQVAGQGAQAVHAQQQQQGHDQDGVGMDVDMGDQHNGTAAGEEHAGPRGVTETQPSGDLGGSAGQRDTTLEEREHLVKHVLLPAMRSHLRPARQRATDGTFVQVASLEKLYRIFERC